MFKGLVEKQEAGPITRFLQRKDFDAQVTLHRDIFL